MEKLLLLLLAIFMGTLAFYINRAIWRVLHNNKLDIITTQHTSQNSSVVSHQTIINHLFDQTFSSNVPLIDINNNIIGRCKLNNHPLGCEVFVDYFNVSNKQDIDIANKLKTSIYSIVGTIGFVDDDSTAKVDIKAIKLSHRKDRVSNIVDLANVVR